MLAYFLSPLSPWSHVQKFELHSKGIEESSAPQQIGGRPNHISPLELLTHPMENGLERGKPGVKETVKRIVPDSMWEMNGASWRIESSIKRSLAFALGSWEVSSEFWNIMPVGCSCLPGGLGSHPEWFRVGTLDHSVSAQPLKGLQTKVSHVDSQPGFHDPAQGTHWTQRLKWVSLACSALCIHHNVAETIMFPTTPPAQDNHKLQGWKPPGLCPFHPSSLGQC